MGGLTGYASLGTGLSPIISMDGLMIYTCNSMRTLEHMMVLSYPAPNPVYAFITESMHAVHSTKLYSLIVIFHLPNKQMSSK